MVIVGFTPDSDYAANSIYLRFPHVNLAGYTTCHHLFTPGTTKVTLVLESCGYTLVR